MQERLKSRARQTPVQTDGILGKQLEAATVASASLGGGIAAIDDGDVQAAIAHRRPEMISRRCAGQPCADDQHVHGWGQCRRRLIIRQRMPGAKPEGLTLMGREIPCVEATPTRPRSSSNNCRDLGVNRRLRSSAGACPLMGREIPCVEATRPRPRSSSNTCRDLGVNRRLRSSAWSLRRIAAPAGCWLYLGTNCLARRSTASVVKTRPGRDDADFFMRVFDYTVHYSHHMQFTTNKDALFVLRKNMEEIKKLTGSSCVLHSLQ